MSSLKEQLKRLAVPQNKLHLEAKKSSLLFDSNEAAALDKEVVYELAISGLNTLTAINKTFTKYEQLLFNKNQLNFNRMLQTKEVNQNLNKIIKQFLIELSPYFLMKSAQKTLEWMVYRYQIHLFNLDDWLMTLFPYHYSNVFIKVLTIIDLENPNSKWHWLNNCANSGIPLPKSVLINHCKKDSVFLHSLFSLVDDYVKVMGRNNSNINLIFEHTNSIALSLLADSSEISEEIVSALVQFSIRGLKSKCLIWETCCYTILASLAANVTLNFDNVLLFCKLIAKKHSDELFKEAICCLSVIVTNQQEGNYYPDDIFNNFKFTEVKLLEIQGIAEVFDIHNLLMLLAKVEQTGFIKKIIDIKDQVPDEPIVDNFCVYDPVSPVVKSEAKASSKFSLKVFYHKCEAVHEEKDIMINFLTSLSYEIINNCDGKIVHKDVDRIVSKKFKQFIKSFKNDLNIFQKHFIQWTTLLSCDTKILREITVKYFQLVFEKLNKNKFPFYHLLKKIIEFGVEITNDSNVIVKLFSQLYSTDSLQMPKLQDSFQLFLDYLRNDDKSYKKVKLGLLNCLRSCHNDQITMVYLNMLDSAVNNDDEYIAKLFVQQLFKCLSSCHPISKHKEEFLKLLYKILSSSDKNLAVVIPTIEHLTELSMKSLPKQEDEKIIITSLIDLATSNDQVLLKAVKKCFKRITLKHYHLVSLLDMNTETSQSQSDLPKLKKIKIERPPLDYLKINTVLEMVLLCKDLDHSKEMCSLLSSLLSKLSTESGSKAEYCTQLTLTILCKIIESWKITNIKSFENFINIEALVQCLRHTSNVQTQQHVLLVLAGISTIFPDQLLHNIVSIFTFMGDSFVQRDNSYTFQVMMKLIDVALSAVKQLPENSKKVDDILLNVFRVFVDARKHIPQHRLMPLFKQLVDFSVDDCLWKLVILIVESSVRHRDSLKVNQNSSDDQKQLQSNEHEIILILFSQYSMETQLRTVNKLITFVDDFLPILKSNNIPTAIVDPGLKNFPHLCRLLIFHMNKVILSLVSDKSFISDFIQSMDGEFKGQKEFESIFNQLVNHFIVHMLNITDQQKTNTTDSIYEKYYPSLLKNVHNILDKLNYLMPAYLFVDVIESLLNHNQPSIQCKGLELMNSKLLQIDHNQSAVKSLGSSVKLVPVLMNLVEVEKERDRQINVNYQKQLCFINMKMLCRYYGVENQQAFNELHKVIEKVLNKHEDTNLAVLDSSLLCLADLISVKKNNFIPHLKPIMIPFMQLFNNDQILKSPVSINCLLMVINKLVLHVGQFLSPFLNNLVQMLCKIFIQTDTKQHWMERLLNLLQIMSKNIECRIILPCLTKAYKELVVKNQHGLFMLFRLFHYLMQNSSKEIINSNMKSIVDLVCTFMDVRVDSSELSMKELADVEKMYIDSILLFVVHLSEVTFRPMFQKLFNSLDDNLDRSLTFYHLVFGLAQKLKSIFNIFASCLIKQMSDLLVNHDLVQDEVKYLLLINFILDTIGECYLHDIDGSFSSGAGDALFKPVVSQLENQLDDEVSYNDMITMHLIPCIVLMTQSIKDNDQLFNLHRMICQQSKHDNYKVRLSVIKVIRGIADGLGTSYEVLFPETAPYLAELLEDDSEKVVKECQDLKKFVERIIDLDSFF